MTRYNKQSFPIIVLDDDEGLLDLFVSIIGDTYRVKTTNSTEKFISMVKNEEPAVAFVDYHLGEITGLELIQSLEGDTRYIMITGDKSTDILQNAINDKKIVGYIAKPFRVKKLKETLDKQYINYVEEVHDEIESSKMRIQSDSYKKEISGLNEHLFETMVNSYTNYRTKDRIAMYLDDIFQSITEKIKQAKYVETRLELLHTLRDIITSMIKYFNTEQLLIIDNFLQLIDSQLDTNRKFEITEFKKVLEDNKKHYSLEIQDQISLIEKFVAEHHQSENLTATMILDKMIETNLVITLMMHSLEETELPNPYVHYMIVVKDDLPIFKSSALALKGDNLSLMTNFISALRSFADEMLSHGAINAIQLEQGVMLVKQKEEILYFCLLDYETFQSRMLLEQFVNETVDYIKEKSANKSLDKDEFIRSKVQTILQGNTDQSSMN